MLRAYDTGLRRFAYPAVNERLRARRSVSRIRACAQWPGGVPLATSMLPFQV